MSDTNKHDVSPIHTYSNPEIKKKSFQFSFPKDKNKWLPIIFVAIVLPLTVVLAMTSQDLRKKASGNEISRVDINPGSISANIETPPQPIHMSTLAFDAAGDPIREGVTYEWSISSQDEVGILTKTEGDLSGFVAKSYGCGVITVVARYGNQTFTKSAGVVVSSGVNRPNCDTVTPTPTAYSLENSQEGVITFAVSAPNTGYGIYATLKDVNGEIVTNQADFSYQWSVDDPQIISGYAFDACTRGIVEPCPEDHFSMRGLKPGLATVNVSVKQISTDKVIATSLFNIEVTAPIPTPSPTPLPTNTPTPTPSPVPGNKVVTLKPTADAFVRSNQINKNFGLNQTVDSLGSPITIGFYKFNLKTLAGKTIVKATLKLNVSDSSVDSQLLQRASDKSWTETTLTYANRPTSVANIRSFLTGPAGKTLSTPVTSPVTAKLGSSITFMISSSGSDKAAFYSREAGPKTPSLVIEYR